MGERTAVGFILEHPLLTKNLNTGVMRYALCMLRELAKLPEIEVTIITNRKRNIPPEFNELRAVEIGSRLSEVTGKGGNLMIPWQARHLDVDVFYNPCQVPTFFRFRKPDVVTVLDVVPTLTPKLNDVPTVISQRLLMPRTLRDATKVVTISQNTKDDIVRHLGVDCARVQVIYPGIDKVFHPEVPEVYAPYVEGKGLPAGFFLFVGALEPRKNLRALLQAVEEMNRERKGSAFAAVVGKTGWNSEEDLQMLKRLEGEGMARYLGGVPDAELCHLYNACRALVFPSHYEGFGYPLVEAMACGRPSVAYRNSSITEVVGEAGVLLETGTPMKAAMTSLIEDDNLYAELCRRSRERAPLFSHEKGAKDLSAVFRSALQ
jgi:alpha-1,3-rhamnosyl/mannosyltransferase